MIAAAAPQLSDEERLIEELGTFAYDPLAFVMWAFPWGEPGDLAPTAEDPEPGPDEWQRWVLEQIRDGLLTADEALQLAISSGHGIGKSALVAWIVLWAFSTFPGTRGVVTANTENQLKTKTWVELAKWSRLFIASSLFNLTATALFARDESKTKEWRIDIVPWSEKNPEAFAGLHNAGKRLLMVFDEASAIADIIWETSEGALTDVGTEIIWLAFGNPTIDTGRFRQCFDNGKFAHRWIQRKVDSRTAKKPNRAQQDKWIEDYGLDSDFVRVRVLGEFPKQSFQSFLSRELVQTAAKRILEVDQRGPVILGVDVARFGDDLSVIWPRRGRDARSLPPRFFQGVNTVQLSQHVLHAANELNAQAVFIDGSGVGGGVVDNCRALGLRVFEVDFGAGPDGYDTDAKYMNKRAEIYGQLREWLSTGAIPERIAERDLVEEFASTTYTINAKGKIQLESKELMKRRGAASPDFTDALACTFAMPFVEASGSLSHKQPQTDYDPHSDENMRAS